MNIIKQLKLRKLNKERERLLNEFTVEDITVQGAWSLRKSLNNTAKRACLMDGLEKLDAKIKAIMEG
ncbi:tRNA (guanine-N1)-methyltransferase [Ligilactobacillus ruminis]|uniref:tRNA (guanine-N1)-methyltransferase n=1 Tax=Ligilactobacillus ruminis TaxID=1623 RepID=UPI00232E0AEF|nr:tRNA (guanine-N1)-methyltransferase [Ligilactobacillus ruminis]MDB7641239.1 tRNA (guanine-N1)-methyltransferase [Ligilactobacillus ruminis]MDB7646153.1 tRNA (guanine-N1)-methyltransferase [Ligilactobacillus ruminis]